MQLRQITMIAILVLLADAAIVYAADDLKILGLSPSAGALPMAHHPLKTKPDPARSVEATVEYTFGSSAYGEILLEAKAGGAVPAGTTLPIPTQTDGHITQGKGTRKVWFSLLCGPGTVPSGNVVALRYALNGPNGATVDKTMNVSYSWSCGPADLRPIGGILIGGLGYAGTGALPVPPGGKVRLKESETPLPPSGGSCAFNVSYTVQNKLFTTKSAFVNRVRSDGKTVGENEVPLLIGGTQKTFTNQVFLKPGEHTLTLTIDDGKQVEESDETNNTVAVSYALEGDCLKPAVKKPPPPTPTSFGGMTRRLPTPTPGRTR